MATAYNVGFQARYTPVREKQYDVNLVPFWTPTTIALNDTWTFCFIPAGAMVTAIGLDFSAGKWDTNVGPTLTLDLGDSGSATRYLSASTIGQTAAGAIVTGVPHYYAADDNLVLKAHAAAATAGLTVLYVSVSYVMDGFTHS